MSFDKRCSPLCKQVLTHRPILRALTCSRLLFFVMISGGVIALLLDRAVAADDVPQARTNALLPVTQIDNEPEEETQKDELVIRGQVKPKRVAVSISGKAVNGKGEPVADATVYVVPVFPMGCSYHDGDERPLAEVKTGADGTYKIDDVKLFVYEFRDEVVPVPQEGQFQLFAVAKGYGYVWRAACHYRPGGRAQDVVVAKSKNSPRDSDGAQAGLIFYENEPIVVELRFTPGVRVYGKITNDLGAPLANATVQVGLINSSRSQFGEEPTTGNAVYLLGSPRGIDGSLEFNALRLIPKESRLAHTDQNGEYEIRGLPKNATLLANVDYLPEYDPYIGYVGTGSKAVVSDDKTHFVREFNQTLIVPTKLQVRVLNDTQDSIRDVIVRYESDGKVGRVGTLTRTDEKGIASLILRSGAAVLYIEPNFGVAYLPHTQQVVLKQAASREESIDVILKPAAEVMIEAVDADTGRPVAGISVLSESTEGGERKELQSQLSFVDHPRTDSQGRLTAVLPPGAWRFFVDQRSLKTGIEPRNPITDPVELQAGKNPSIRFEFSVNQTAEERNPSVANLPSDFVELVEKQQKQFHSIPGMRLQVESSDNLSRRVEEEWTRSVLQTIETETFERCIDFLKKHFEKSYSTGGSGLIVTDGERRRVEYSSDSKMNVYVDNGRESIQPMGDSQLSIYDSKKCQLGFLNVSDFWRGPASFELLEAGNKTPKIKCASEDGLWKLEISTDKFKRVILIDSVTGLVRTNSAFYQNRLVRFEGQYFPVVQTNGIAVPQLCVNFRMEHRSDAVDEKKLKYTFGYTLIKKIEFVEHLPSEAFLVAVQAGVTVVDFRGEDSSNQEELRRPFVKVLSSTVPDVIAYRDRFEPPRLPALRVGDPAPKFEVDYWVNASGKIASPNLDGKVVLIDFWGIGCGFCVVQLPEVNAAFEHFANNPKFALIGLHDSGPTADIVSEFLKKRDVGFSTAVDKPKTNSFGVTYSKFGVDAIPAAAVIDPNGTVVYLGNFKRALKVAADLIK